MTNTKVKKYKKINDDTVEMTVTREDVFNLQKQNLLNQKTEIDNLLKEFD